MDWNRPRKYEFALVVGLIGVLAVLLLGALERMQQEIEETAVQSEAATLRAELLERLAHREVRGGGLPASRNPLEWVARRPEAYLGELDGPPPAVGVWYFDRRQQELVYRFRSGREARFRLVQGAALANVPGGLAGVGLQRVDGGKSVK